MSKAELKTMVWQLVWMDALAAFLLALMVISAASGFLTSSDHVGNMLTVGRNTSHMEEEYGSYGSFEAGNSYTKVVQVRNDDCVPCYVRVFAEITDPAAYSAIHIDFDREHWSDVMEDGYRYYHDILEVGESTAPLFTTLTAEADVRDFKMICYSETVQAEGHRDAVEAFRAIR